MASPTPLSFASNSQRHKTTRESHTSSAKLENVKIRIPSFWTTDPEMWFLQLETQLTYAGITGEKTKCCYVVSSLNVNSTREAKDILEQPGLSYSQLKSALIQKFSAIQEEKTRRLLEHEEIGDRKPSEFLQHLRELAGPATKESFLRSIWLELLPGNLQTLLVTQKDSDLDTVAKLGDMLADTFAKPKTEIWEAHTRLLELFGQIHEGFEVMRNLLKQQSLCDQLPVQDASDENNSEYWCWYHTSYGAEARKCESPCTFR